MENQNHLFDDIDFGIYLAEEGDNLFAQEEATPVQSVITLPQMQFLQIHNMIYERCNQPVSNPVNGGIEEDFLDEDYHQWEEGNCLPFFFLI